MHTTSVMTKHQSPLSDEQIADIMIGQNALEGALLNVRPTSDLITDCHKALVLAKVEPLPISRLRIVQR